MHLDKVHIHMASETGYCSQLTSESLKAPAELNAAGMLPESWFDDTSKRDTAGNTLSLLGNEPLQTVTCTVSTTLQPFW